MAIASNQKPVRLPLRWQLAAAAGMATAGLVVAKRLILRRDFRLLGFQGSHSLLLSLNLE